MIVKNNDSGNYEPLPTGLQNAICVNVFDCGLQRGAEIFGGKVQHKCVVLWELEADNSEGQHFTATKIYTASLGEKANLRHDLESWRGQGFTEDELGGFELDNIKSHQCTLNLVRKEKTNGKTYTEISAVLPVLKSAGKIEIQTSREYIPEFVKRMIENQLPAEKVEESPSKVDNHFDDDIPF